MARRSRSLSELPGHLRVPILKRKDTERTQARLEAGLAGMEELRVLREKQEQLFGDTMARVDTRQRHHRRHSDNGSLTPESSKISRSVGPTPANPHGLVSSWQSASSLASISEEGDSASPRRDIDKNNNNNNNNNNVFHHHHHHHKSKTSRDNYDVYSSSFNHNSNDNNTAEKVKNCQVQHHQERRPLPSATSKNDEHSGVMCHFEGQHRQNTDMRRPWWSEEDLCQYPMANDRVHTSHQAQNSTAHVNTAHTHGRSVSVTTDSRVVSGLSSVPSNSRRYSTSMINDSQTRRECPQSKSTSHYKGKMKSSNQPRFPLSTISNIQAEAVEGQPQMVNCHGQVNFHGQVNRHGQAELAKPSSSSIANRRHMSWDNLLKTIGISSSTSSLPSLDEDETSDANGNVFCSTESQDNGHEQNAMPDRTARQKLGRSLSFSYGNTTEYSKKYWHTLHGQSTGTSVDDRAFREGVTSSSVPPLARASQVLNPIMRRASMQCEAVLTNSNVERRIVNPIQDVDINRLTSPGPVHAVMLQYTSREVGSVANVITNNVNRSTLERQPRNDHRIKIQDGESEHQLLKAPVRDSGKECKEVKNSQVASRDLEPNATMLSKGRTYYCGKRPLSINYDSMDNAAFSETDFKGDNDTKPQVLKQPERSKKRANFTRKDSLEMDTRINQTIPDSGLKSHAKDDIKNFSNEMDGMCVDDSLSKVSPIRMNDGVTASSLFVKKMEHDESNKSNDNQISLAGRESSEKAVTAKIPQTSTEQHFAMPDTPSSQSASELTSKNGNSCIVRYDSELKGRNKAQALHCLEPITDVHQESRFSLTGDSTHTDSVSRISSSSVDHTNNPGVTVTITLTPSAGNETKEVDNDAKHNHGHVNKVTCSLTSSDVSVISDEGYSTCDSVGPCSKRNRSSIAESLSSVIGDTFRPTPVTSQANSVGRSIERQDVKQYESFEIPKSPEHSQSLSVDNEVKYDNVAVLEQGIAIVWNAESRNNAKKSLHCCEIASKSFKQTAV